MAQESLAGSESARRTAIVSQYQCFRRPNSEEDEGDSNIEDDGNEDDAELVNPGTKEILFLVEEGLRKAPAEDHHPVPVLLEKNFKYFAFPKMFGEEGWSQCTVEN